MRSATRQKLFQPTQRVLLDDNNKLNYKKEEDRNKELFTSKNPLKTLQSNMY